MNPTEKIFRSAPLLEMIVKNQFYNCGANDNQNLMAALTRCVCFCFQFDKASYEHLKALKLEVKSQIPKSDGDIFLQFYHIQDAILGYNSCYDTLLQIIKFAFQLAPELHTQEDFLDAINNCRWTSDPNTQGIKELLQQKYSDNMVFPAFLKKSISFFETTRRKNAEYANKIKHGGGILIPPLQTFIPSVSKVNQKVSIIKKADGTLHFGFPKDITSFKMEWLYPDVVESQRLLQILQNQNAKIFEYAQYLFQFLKYDTLKDIPPYPGNTSSHLIQIKSNQVYKSTSRYKTRYENNSVD